MARSRSPVSTPAPEPAAPLPTALLSGPRLFAQTLALTEPVAWRYLGVAALSAALSGLAYAALVRPAVLLAAAVDGSTAPMLVHITNVMGGTFLGMFTFLLMWGLGWLGAGRAARPAEVFGASFALLPPLYLIVTVLAFLIPDSAWRPGAAALAAAGSDPQAVQRAALAGLRTTAPAFLLLAVTLLGTAAQCALAYPAFRELTGRPGRALAGAALPLLPALAVGVIALGPLLFSR
ncbi:hypothetical protein LAJ19_09415 [Deinococcus taeanensis]|uniref:hypothetical protein n=1 Tax=Deinococcus taeanensis TaxID=2737050 RepID=UPI001CDD64C1|nr:hypothetical protein [Deinococcus taeanensis]UBV41863.1 hypothetical protein LAJ19_09415 [Deinococcus taeanensis]